MLKMPWLVPTLWRVAELPNICWDELAGRPQGANCAIEWPWHVSAFYYDRGNMSVVVLAESRRLDVTPNMLRVVATTFPCEGFYVHAMPFDCISTACALPHEAVVWG